MPSDLHLYGHVQRPMVPSRAPWRPFVQLLVARMLHAEGHATAAHRQAARTVTQPARQSPASGVRTTRRPARANDAAARGERPIWPPGEARSIAWSNPPAGEDDRPG